VPWYLFISLCHISPGEEAGNLRCCFTNFFPNNSCVAAYVASSAFHLDNDVTFSCGFLTVDDLPRPLVPLHPMLPLNLPPHWAQPDIKPNMQQQPFASRLYTTPLPPTLTKIQLVQIQLVLNLCAKHQCVTPPSTSVMPTKQRVKSPVSFLYKWLPPPSQTSCFFSLLGP
jgi:hypothetical protein